MLKSHFLSHGARHLSLEPQKISKTEFPWATGLFKFEGLEFRLFLHHCALEHGVRTEAEDRYLQERKGLTDTYLLILRGPEKKEDHIQISGTALKDQLQGVVDQFLKTEHVKTHREQKYFWRDYE